jgi:hypothetical protein
MTRLEQTIEHIGIAHLVRRGTFLRWMYSRIEYELVAQADCKLLLSAL